MKKHILLAAIFLFLTSPLKAEDDFQYWSLYTAKIVDTEKIDFNIHGQARFFNDVKDFGLYFISPQLKLDFFENVSLQANYTYLQVKSNTGGNLGDDFKYHHRLELEANPRAWAVGKWLKISNRNRVEFRWIEDNGSDNTRFRHRLMFTFPLKKWAWLKDFYFNSEFFYNHSDGRFDENRTVPAGLTFKLNDKVDLGLFYMIQFQESRDNWKSNEILGTHLVMKF